MAAYRQVSFDQLRHLLASYRSIFHFSDIEDIRLEPISSGIENSNFWLTIGSKELVLTVFEQLTQQEVRHCVRLAQHLGRAKMSVPMPLSDENDQWLHSVQGRPAIVCARLRGTSVVHPKQEHLKLIGQQLATAHQVSSTLQNPPVDQRNIDWWCSLKPEINHYLSALDMELLDEAIDEQILSRSHWIELPNGWIHGDCFRDNVLFFEHNGQVQFSAILDWYNACHGPYVYDLAIVFQDWCVKDDGSCDINKANALVSGYESVRTLTSLEKTLWPVVCRAAALRFWLSRLLAFDIAKKQGRELPAHKNPDFYRNRWRSAKSIQSLCG